MRDLEFPPHAEYLAHTDDELSLPSQAEQRIDAKTLASALCIHALLNEHLLVHDVSLLLNVHMQELLLDKAFAHLRIEALLAKGVLVPIVRREAESFSQLAEIVEECGTRHHADRSRIRDMAARLDTLVTAAPRPCEAFEPAYLIEMIKRLEDQELMRHLGLEKVAPDVVGAVARQRRPERLLDTRTEVFNIADRLTARGWRRKAALLRKLSSVVYHELWAEMSYSHPGFPGEYGTTAQALLRFPAEPSSLPTEKLLREADSRVFFDQTLDMAGEIVRGPIPAESVISIRDPAGPFQRFIQERLRAEANADAEARARGVAEALYLYLNDLRDVLGSTGSEHSGSRVRLVARSSRWAERLVTAVAVHLDPVVGWLKFVMQVIVTVSEREEAVERAKRRERALKDAPAVDRLEERLKTEYRLATDESGVPRQG